MSKTKPIEFRSGDLVQYNGTLGVVIGAVTQVYSDASIPANTRRATQLVDVHLASDKYGGCGPSGRGYFNLALKLVARAKNETP